MTVTIILSVLIIIAVVFAGRRIFLNKKNGKNGCGYGYGCVDCPSREICHMKDDSNKL